MSDLQIASKEIDIILAELAKTKDINGDVVEFGCYAGDTSILLAESLRDQPEKWLYLYDSFEGLPEKSSADYSSSGRRFTAGALRASPDAVISKFKKHNLPEPVIIKSWFNKLKDTDLPNLISFALFDGDFYESIKDSFLLIAPKMNRGGIIIVHDYRNPALPGSAKAVNEFIDSHPTEYKTRIASSLAILVKQ